ncbi:substrate-binding domain-containing protein [Haloferula sp. BvORR071]|uniref:substrate-binding domain-containing protein n=1 Tax=Haloferula sp. BvORR071 TaxID=1396141 RepID=UPI002240FC1A|nr:substrate-binding domain-containing protein [Haloferula sp. BvORR071]
MPARGNLVADCVRVMKLRLEAGEWGARLPGERRLAEILQVGRDTIRLALQQLEREGVLEPAGTGSRRRITGTVGKREETAALRIGLLVHRQLEQLPQPTLFEIDGIRRVLGDKGGSLEVISPAWYEQRNPANRLETLLEEVPCSAWILLRSSAAVQEWFMRQQVPCLLRGYPHPGIELPHLDVDWHATARHAAGYLWRMGHRRVVVLSPADPLKGVEAAVRGVMELGESGFEASVQVENGTAIGIGRVLARALQTKSPPSAIIATRPRQAATALTWLASQGIRVPQHLSLITLAWEPFLDYLIPEITGYRADPAAVAKLVMRRLERITAGDRNPGGNSWIEPTMVKGASVAKI